jgi:hypothetical protein
VLVRFACAPAVNGFRSRTMHFELSCRRLSELITGVDPDTTSKGRVTAWLYFGAANVHTDSERIATNGIASTCRPWRYSYERYCRAYSRSRSAVQSAAAGSIVEFTGTITNRDPRLYRRSIDAIG